MSKARLVSLPIRTLSRFFKGASAGTSGGAAIRYHQLNKRSFVDRDAKKVCIFLFVSSISPKEETPHLLSGLTCEERFVRAHSSLHDVQLSLQEKKKLK